MKYTRYIIYSLLVLTVFISSCEKEYEDNAKVTPAPSITLNGDNPLLAFIGNSYDDPGVTAMEIIGDDTTKNLTYEILGEVDVNIPGKYTVHYKVVNSEGVAFYVPRVVQVVDLTGYDVFEIPEGAYQGLRVGRSGGNVTIKKVATGIYSVSDLLVGYYEQVAGYGSRYAAPGVFVIDQNGNLRSELGYVAGWQETVEAVNLQFDAGTNTFSYVATFESGFSFNAELTLK